MTREKAIECLNFQNEKFFGGQSEALKMAISALSENKGDLISRQTVLDLFQMKYSDKELYKAIYELPAVENKEDWIPISSGELPKIGQRVLATIESLDDGRTVRETTYDKYGFLCGNGVAWMPLPEPYKERGE